MKSRLTVLLLVCFAVLLAVPTFAFAQTAPPAPAPDVAGCVAKSPADAFAYVIALGRAPGTSAILFVYDCVGFRSSTVGNTLALFRAACETDIAIYKVDDQGQQGLWNVPGRVCDGNVLTLVTEGTGTYIGYRNLASTAPVLPPIIRPGGA
jgi:hypothetical protein